MSHSGSFGVNYLKVWDGVSISLPAAVGDLGSSTKGDFVFVQAAAAISQYDFVVITDDGQASPLTTTNAGSGNKQVGVAQLAVADNEYFWAFTGGVQGGGVGVGIKGNVLASYAADAPLYTTATAGSADDAVTTKIQGVTGLTTVVGAGSVELKSSGPISVN